MNALAKLRDAPKIQISRVLRDSTFYLLGNIASRILGFVAIPFYSHYLSPAQYGIIELIELSTQIVALTFGLQSIGAVLSRLFHDQDTREKEASIVSTSVLSTAMLSALIAAGGVMAAGPLSRAVFHSAEQASLLQVAFIAMWFANMVEVVLVYERIRQRARFFFYYSICMLVANFSLNIYFIGFVGAGVWGFVYSKLIVTAIGSAFLLFRTLREVGLHWQKAYLPQFIRLGLPLLAASVSAFVIHFSDRFFLANAVTLAQLGQYALAYRFAFLVSVFVGESFNRSWSVTLYRYAQEEGWRVRFAQVAAYLVFALYLTGLAISLMAPELFSFMVPQSFYPPYLLLPLLVIAYLFRETGDFFRGLLLINKRAQTIGTVTFSGAAVNLLLNIALIPSFGIYGAALATLGTWAIYMGVCWVIAWREHRVPVSILAFAKINLFALMIFAAGDWLRVETTPIQIAVDCLWIGLFIALCIMFYFSSEERKEIQYAFVAQAARMVRARPRQFTATATRLPTVLMLAYYFPPENAIGAARPARFTKYLSRLGFPIRVISQWIVDSETDPPANNHRPAVGQRAIIRPGKITSIRVPSPDMAHGPAHKISRLLHFLSEYAMPYDDRLAWVPFAYRAASLIVADDPNIVIVSSHPPFASHLTGLVLKLRHGRPWIADFRDPLASNPIRTSARAAVMDAFFQKLIFQYADVVIANTDAVRHIWNDHYPQWRHKIHLVWNGFDPEDAIIPRPISSRARRTIAHIGTIYGGRTPWPLIESLDRLINDGSISADSIQLRLLGPITNHCLDTSALPFQRLLALGCLHIDNRMAPHAEAREELLRADYLILLDIVGDAVPGMQLPAKIFDYIRACRPILAFTPENSVITRVIALAEITSVCISPSASAMAIDRAVLAFLALPRTEIHPSNSFLHDFDAVKQTYTLANLISQISTPRA